MAENKANNEIINDIKVDERLSPLDKDEKTLYLYIAGEAGTGKSNLLRILIDAVKFLKMESGDTFKKKNKSYNYSSNC